MPTLRWLRARYNERRVRGRALEEAAAARAAGGTRQLRTVTMLGPDGWTAVHVGEDEWVEDAVSWAWEQWALLEEKLREAEIKLVQGRLYTRRAESLDLLLKVPDRGPMLTELTSSKRPQEAHDAACQKLKKYFDASSTGGPVGVLAVGDNAAWFSVFDAWCSAPTEMDATTHLRMTLRTQAYASGYQKRERGIGADAEVAWRQENAAKQRQYEQTSRENAPRKRKRS